MSVPLLVLAVSWLLLHLVSNDLRAHQKAQLRARATAVAVNANRFLHAREDDQPVVAENSRRRLVDSARDMGIRLTGPDGTLSAGPQPDSAVRLPDRAPLLVTVNSGGKTWHVLSRRVYTAEEGSEPNLWIFAPDSAYQAELSLVRKRVVMVTLLAAPSAGVIAWAISARAVFPLRRLQRRTSGLDPRNSATRLEHTPTRITEVDDLAHTVQTVFARYDEQVARTSEALATARSFTAAASHELRTPLMSMRTNLDILTAHADLNAVDRAEVLDDLGREHTRLLGLLVMLKTLGQGDLVEADSFTPLDLAEVVEDAVSDLRRAHPDVAVSVRVTSGLLVQGWEQGLRSAVDNLLANAWTHGRTESGHARIEVTLHPSGDPHRPAALLTVDDRGPGIPAARREEVFERFRRGPNSPGSGLGLTLVAQQITLHQGRIAVQDRPDGQPGARFEVWLPVTDTCAVEQTLPLMRRDWLTAATGRQDPRMTR
ncbi:MULTISPECIES: HAMP domain-containing sensor histidine kinase [unclassified Streptomyces]|uniref:sensor histidine kinase n=1 Tax=unclassified Streptomyces TaxID=2593676 RepID=UPI002DD7BE21|nr:MULTISPECIES: HAMP domain-containing sensor histidine kinase [unclassified Streptomyces]WSA91406.1 HAMP domain-containing histidine kinase [Streptomyces sp. NBC_01795]WSB75730.1 HAMP domain-containing histidine kinase [Streptomyces sp. NBC_01775]WSS15985.1 HAMP domain-containing histidine kinase [Streptomyces sp. NBC_01186]WSS44803.1 HAMP domain-containing histidine kinase [Streptomyces sp. NBC_01187]